MLYNHPKRQFGAYDIHLADLLGEEVHVVETVVVTSKLSWHGIEVIRPRGEDEEGAFGAGEETLAFGLFGDGFLLEVDEGKAGVDSDVLHFEFARRDAGRDEDGVVLGSFDPGLSILEPRLGIDVAHLGARPEDILPVFCRESTSLGVFAKEG